MLKLAAGRTAHPPYRRGKEDVAPPNRISRSALPRLRKRESVRQNVQDRPSRRAAGPESDYAIAFGSRFWASADPESRATRPWAVARARERGSHAPGPPSREALWRVHRSLGGGGSAPAKRRARARVGESDGRGPSVGFTSRAAQPSDRLGSPFAQARSRRRPQRSLEEPSRLRRRPCRASRRRTGDSAGSA